MDRLKLLDAGLQVFDPRLPDVAAPLCVVTRYRGSSCRLCLDTCPADAIETTPWLRVDPERCTSCGACAARCKTGALSFVSRARQVRERLREARLTGAREVTFVCRMADAHSGAVRAGRAGDGDGGSAAVAVPCLGALSASDLVAAAASGASSVSLVDGGCPGCIDRAAGLAVDGVVDSVVATLADLAPAFAVRHRAAPAARPRPATPVKAEAATMSRRGLFVHLAQGLRRTASEAAVSAKPPVASLHEHGSPPTTRAWLQHDLAALARSAAVEDVVLSQALPFGRVSVGSGCDGCGLCQRYCPHEALAEASPEITATTGERDGPPVAADDSRCTGCGLCVESCPRQALSLGPAHLSGATQSDVRPATSRA